MSFVTRTLLTNPIFKRIFNCNHIYNELRLSYAQYHTIYTKSQYEDKKELVKRDYSVLSSMKFAFMNLSTRLKIMQKYGFDSLPLIGLPKLRLIGFNWYKSIDEVNVIEYFTLFDLPDTFYSRFKVVELHVWMLLYILPRNTRRNTAVRYALIEAMWEDHQVRAKLVKSFNKNYKKNFRDLYDKFKVSLMLYDIGYIENDMSLASAVWCNFFDKQDVDPRYLEVLVRYIRHQINHLNNLNIEKLEETEIKGIWLPVQPHINAIIKRASV